MNRFQEGLRVIEESVRFILNNKELSDDIKKIRHEYSALKNIIPDNFIIKRNSIKDVGKKSKNEKLKRKNILEIVKTSFGRTEESMRVIEEYSKLFSRDLSIKAKNIRFLLYELEKKTIIVFNNNKMIFPENFGLYLVITNPIIGYEKITEIAVKNKVRVIQLREKNADDKKILRIAKNIARITKKSDTIFIVNDRIDIALLSEADGVHLGQTDISVKEARKISETLIIGKSTHNIKQVKNALKEKPDYIGIGPIYKTNSKTIPDPVLGIKNAKDMLKITNVPAIAIGGIKEFNLPKILNAGFENFGIISYITESRNPNKEIKNIIRIYRSYYDTKN